MKYLILIVAAFLSRSAMASINVGNGGLIVECLKPKLQNLQLLEFVEAAVLWNLPARSELSAFRPTDPTAVDSVVKNVLTKIDHLDPKRAAQLRDGYLHFNENAFYIPNVILTPTNDENSIALPIGCNIKQAVVQLNPEFPGEKRYNVSLDLWNRLQQHPIDQAGLILHELLYREAIANGQVTSRRTRYLNAYLFSESINSATLEQYQNVLTVTGFPRL